MKRIRNAALAAALGLSSMVFEGCPASGLIDDCFGEDTISREAYQDLNDFEQLFYEENDCGRYETTSDFWDPFF